MQIWTTTKVLKNIAFMDERIACKNPECTNTILLDTAQRNDGFCMPCVNAAKAKAHKEYIKANRRDVNAFEGINDPVEILKIIHAERKFNPLINWIPYPVETEEIYSKLLPEDQKRMAEYCLSLINGDSEKPVIPLLCLAAFTDANIDECLRACVARNRLYPGFPFHKSPPDVRDSLIELIKNPQNMRLINHILVSLAWIGDAVVVDLFENWRKRPPTWKTTLYIPPHVYAHEAGWELVDGKRRDLYFNSCRKLVKGPSTTPLTFLALTDREDDCPWCQSKLTNFFDLNPSEYDLMRDSAFSERIKIPTCINCTAFGYVFGQNNLDGGAVLLESNERPTYLPSDIASWDRLPTNSLTVGPPSSPFSAAHYCYIPTKYSRLGGHPTWVQDAEYPKCPRCSKTMMFLAQIAAEVIVAHSEGQTYGFVCPDCGSTATSYQQT